MNLRKKSIKFVLIISLFWIFCFNKYDVPIHGVQGISRVLLQYENSKQAFFIYINTNNLMKKTYLPMLFGALLTACQSSPEQAGSNAHQTLTEANTPTANQAPKPYTAFVANKWYQGQVDGAPIWLYMRSLDGDYIYADYGYDSQGGKHIGLTGKWANGQLTLEYEALGSKPYKETFVGTHDPATGAIKGEWKNAKKTAAFELNSVATIPATSTDFLNAFADLPIPFEYGDYTISSLIPGDYKPHFQAKKAAAAIPNITDFIPKEKAELSNGNGVLIGKTALPNNQWMAIFAANQYQEEDNSGDPYGELPEGMLYAAVLDSKGNCLDATTVGNDVNDTYYLDISIKIAAADRIEITRTSYENAGMEGRIEYDKTETTIRVVNGKLETME